MLSIMATHLQLQLLVIAGFRESEVISPHLPSYIPRTHPDRWPTLLWAHSSAQPIDGSWLRLTHSMHRRYFTQEMHSESLFNLKVWRSLEHGQRQATLVPSPCAQALLHSYSLELPLKV